MNNSTRTSKRRFITLMCVVWLAVPGQLGMAQNNSTVTVQVDKPGSDISVTIFGIFFEDINFGADDESFRQDNTTNVLSKSAH